MRTLFNLTKLKYEDILNIVVAAFSTSQIFCFTLLVIEPKIMWPCVIIYCAGMNEETRKSMVEEWFKAE